MSGDSAYICTLNDAAEYPNTLRWKSESFLFPSIFLKQLATIDWYWLVKDAKVVTGILCELFESIKPKWITGWFCSTASCIIEEFSSSSS